MHRKMSAEAHDLKAVFCLYKNLLPYVARHSPRMGLFLGSLEMSCSFTFFGSNNVMQFDHLGEFLKCHAVKPSWVVYKCSAVLLSYGV